MSPNAYLTAVARQVLGDRVTIFESRFEDVQTDRRYDLILFGTLDSLTRLARSHNTAGRSVGRTMSGHLIFPSFAC